MDVITDTDIREALRHVVDPEIGVNIVDLGLVYRVEVADARVRVTMTMTSPACPLAGYLRELATSAIRSVVPEAVGVEVHVVSEPPWSPDMMSDEARRQLGEGGR